MSRTIHALDNDGSPISLTVSQDCIIFIEGVEPDQESIIQMTDLNNQSERTEFVGARPKR